MRLEYFSDLDKKPSPPENPNPFGDYEDDYGDEGK